MYVIGLSVSRQGMTGFGLMVFFFIITNLTRLLLLLLLEALLLLTTILERRPHPDLQDMKQIQ
jgi:hypothetical protein